ncbi:STAS domain-containing protein [Pontibacter sp. FD36]|uniref:Anti-sigma factor antagonist n=1 Tax=Pontibacter lucknowensis TaxID=1077936 RepID=A0A1N7B3U4_9BACT|nr:MULTISPECIES: STAS domain-containing protein [Pontibacter]EJF09189.1 anti-sigma F factor antagonist [Pontibacter sp. BAB1700]MBF8965559.1 STAS domain-containing protein [Pontibacter sp. FD36]SIR45928.1 anti-sigma B factor antagonist [Pontibacter lucknowensis]
MKTFSVTTDAIGKGVLLRFKGELDASSSVYADNALEETIAASSGFVLIDCSELTYISSAGLGVLLAAFQACNLKEMDLVMVNMQPKIRNVFEILGLDRLIKSAETVEEARQMIAK